MKPLPDRKFQDGPRKLIAWRLPQPLIDEVQKVAKLQGWNVSDVASTALDLYVQEWKSQKKKKRR